MSVSTLNTILTLTALALAGTAVSLAGPPLIYLGTWQSKTRNLLPAFITSVVAALLYLAIVDTTPWPASPEGVSIQLRGLVEFYGAGLLWALRVITLPLLFTAVTALIVLIFTATKLAHSWLTGHSDQTCAAYNVTRAEALRRAWRLRSAERRFARGLTSDLLGSATRKKRGAISWDRDPAFVDFATGFVMTPAADYYSISGYDIEDHIDRAEQRPEISTVELLTVDDCHDDPVPPSQSETMFIVRWNGEYLSRPLLPAATTAGTGAIFFGRWPLRDRIRRAASRPGGPAVIVGAAMALVVLAGALLGAPDQPLRNPTPYILPAPELSAPIRPFSHLLQADQRGGEACSLRRSQPQPSIDDPCAHAGVAGDRYYFMFDDTKVITAVAVDPVMLKPDRTVHQVIWRFDGDPDNGYPATERVQNIDPLAASVELRLDHEVRASTVTIIVADTRPRVGAANRRPAQGAAAIRLIGYDAARQSGAGHSACSEPVQAPSQCAGETAPTGHDDSNRPGA